MGGFFFPWVERQAPLAGLNPAFSRSRLKSTMRWQTLDRISAKCDLSNYFA
jgi:hypothetical protein